MTTKAELRESPWYKLVKELVQKVEENGVNGEPFELALEAVLKHPNPNNMPVAAAVKTKVLFLMSIYQLAGRFGGLMDAVPGHMHAIEMAMEELHGR